MIKHIFIFLCWSLFSFQLSRAQDIHVSTNGSNVYPFDSLATAATNIHDAVNGASSGVVVRIHPGTYVLTNSLVITNSLSLIGVNGAETSILDGNEEVQCIVSYHPDTLVEGLTVQNGIAQDIPSGGGIYLVSGGVVRASTICNNRAYAQGGGISILGNGLVDSCFIVSNYVDATYDSAGGGVNLGDNATLRNCVVAYNQANRGGGVFSYANQPRVESSTIVFNNANNKGGGIQLSRGSVENSIVYYNSAPLGDNWYQHWYDDDIVSNSCIFPMPPDLGNISSPPQFMDPENGNFQLQINSPCVDAGRTNDWMSGDTDLASNPRLVGDKPDIGAYELQPSGLFASISVQPCRGTIPMQVTYSAAVHNTNSDLLFFEWDIDANGVVDNSGWGLTNLLIEYGEAGTYSLALSISKASDFFYMVYSNRVFASPTDIYVSQNGSHSSPFTDLATASTNIQTALNLAMDGATVWVDDGTFQINETLFHHRPVTLQSLHGKDNTILDGMNERSIIQIWNPEAIVNGFTIINGYGTSGGGIASLGGGKIMNSTIASNTANAGGGIFGIKATCVTNCSILHNSSTGGGGAGLNLQNGTVSDCVIEHNTADGTGGGLWIMDSTVNSSTIVSNQASRGGGIVARYSNHIRQCKILNNVATYASAYTIPSGGGILQDYGNGSVENTLIARNESSCGGGLALNLGRLSIINCSIVFNTASTGAGIYHYTTIPSYTNSIIGHNVGEEIVTEISMGVTPWPLPQYINTIIGTNFLFRDPARGDFRLQWDSPGINSGTNLPDFLAAVDLDGKPRILDGIMDCGAYEQYPPDLDTDEDSLPDGWEWQYYGNITNANPGTVPGKDPFTNEDHCIAGTDPLDPDSYPRFEKILMGETNSAGQVILQWTSYPERIYTIYRFDDLIGGASTMVASNLPATSPLNSYVDSNATGVGPWIYRLGIRLDN